MWVQSAEQQWQAVAEADEFEVGSLYSPGSKKQVGEMIYYALKY